MNKITPFLLLSLLSPAAVASQAQAAWAKPAATKTAEVTTPASVVQDLYAAFGKGDMDKIMSLLDPNIVWIYHAPESSIPFAGTYKGREGVADFFRNDGKFVQVNGNDLKGVHAAGDTVFVVGQENGTARATGKSFAAPWVHMFTVKAGKIVEFQEFIDSATIANALK